MYSNVLISFLLLILAKHCMAIINRDLMAIDLDDILNEKLMPMSIFKMTENSDNAPIDESGVNDIFQSNTRADFKSAYDLMQFHRRMIQNYKCNNYIAKQILFDIAPHTLNNRLGIAPNSTSKNSEIFSCIFFTSNISIEKKLSFVY